MSSLNPDSFNLRVNFPVKLLGILVLFIVIVLAALYFYITRSLENTFIFASASAAAAGTILAAFYSARILSLNLEQNTRSRIEYLSNIDLKKKEIAIGYAARWTDPHMQKSRKTCREIANLRGHSLEQIKVFLDSEEKQSDVFHLLNFFEEMGTAIDHEMVDSSILKDLYREPLAFVWESLQLWVEDYKKEHLLSYAWNATEKLYQTWKR